ncbi:MAG TPA: response regulator transcription factor [Solirubrobacteraceae bacterium]|jgi:DNA-binding response OmpR family regulator|nr:response regulator transcription factor [Solirubrobacteraceae bacterium]
MSSTQAALALTASPAPLRLGSSPWSLAERSKVLTVGIVDRDDRFAGALCEVMSVNGWRLRRLPDLPPPRVLSQNALAALLVDVASADETALRDLAQVERSSHAAIVVCSEDSTVAQRVRGLEAGLDGWIEKPCSPEETLARVRAIVRGRNAGRRVVPGPMRSGELEVRHDRFDAIAHGRTAELTTREFEVLELLVRHEHLVLAREQIYEAIWGYEMLVGDRVVDIFVSRIRRKLAQISPDWHYLHTHPGDGYRFAAKAGADDAPDDPGREPATVLPIDRRARQGEGSLVVA